MSLKNSRKVLRSILAKSVIFVNFAVMIDAGCAGFKKNVSARHLP
jgi:hypothetical protein